MAVKPNIIDVNDLLKRQEHHTVLYFNYDNEAFMNTGIQESGASRSGSSPKRPTARTLG
jgi:pyruvate/2-oxoacid:ferredoxin oxidoreductase beta subunit